jgi:hypothetical protein
MLVAHVRNQTDRLKRVLAGIVSVCLHARDLFDVPIYCVMGGLHLSAAADHRAVEGCGRFVSASTGHALVGTLHALAMPLVT